MQKSRLIEIKCDSEYNKLLLAEKEVYYNDVDVNFHSTYRAMNRKLEWREPTTPRKIFFEIFAKISINPNWVFLDCGSGLGHVMYLASFLFNTIYGVEYLNEISEIAKKNLQLLMQENTNYKIFCCDMFDLDISILNEVNVFYISSPFTGDRMFERFIKKIEKSLLNQEREVWLIYFYPYCEDIMKKYIDLFPLKMSIQTIGKTNYYHHIKK
jgi:hypothetical protein